MKKGAIFFLIVLLLILGVGLFLNANKASWLEHRIQRDLEKLTGVPVVIDPGIRVTKLPGPNSWFAVDLPKIRLKNPSGFHADGLADSVQNHLELNLASLLKGRWKIRRLISHLEKIQLEVNPEGEYNLSRLSALKMNQAAPALHFKINRWEYTLGVMKLLEDGSSPEAQNKSYDFGAQKEVYENVTDPRVLVQAPALKLVYRLNRGSLGLSRGKIQENIAQHSGQK